MTASNMQICAIDVETTGLRIPTNKASEYDEIVQLAIIANDHTIMFNELFHPEHMTTWPEAEACNGISFERVKERPFFRDQCSAIQGILDRFDLMVAYNAEFDIAFMRHQGLNFTGKRYFCMMRAFSQLRTKRQLPGNALRRYTLTQCAQYFNIPATHAHDACSDANTVLSCFEAMCALMDVNVLEV